jgi:serine/threonine protein kinase
MVIEIMAGLPHLKNSQPLKSFSPDAQDLIQRMLTKDISARLSAEEALCHPWFRPLREQ